MNAKTFALAWICGMFASVPMAQAGPGSDEMVRIPAGSFWMGSPDGAGDPDEHPRHQVYLNAFEIDKYPVTFDQYDRFCDATGRVKPGDNGWGRGTRPVINVAWDDALAYAQWAGLRLPTEAEYEKALRGGTDTEYFFENDENRLGDYAWYGENSGGMTHPVGQKKPNPFGLYDIAGDVWEWCSDWYGEDYYAGSPAQNPQGPDSGPLLCLRGGCWKSFSDSCRSSNRNENTPKAGVLYGFRCAKSD